MTFFSFIGEKWATQEENFKVSLKPCRYLCSFVWLQNLVSNFMIAGWCTEKIERLSKLWGLSLQIHNQGFQSNKRFCYKSLHLSIQCG